MSRHSIGRNSPILMLLAALVCGAWTVSTAYPGADNPKDASTSAALTGAAAADEVADELDGWRAPEESRATANPIVADEASLERGSAMYRKACAKCHGKRGAGDGRVAKMLDVTPADLSMRVPYQADGELFWKLGEGRPPMPSFAKDLSAEQRWDLVNYMRLLAPGAAGDTNAGSGSDATEPDADDVSAGTKESGW